MRFNELLSGVRSDLAVKVYGDDFVAMENTANDIARVCAACAAQPMCASNRSPACR